MISIISNRVIVLLFTVGSFAVLIYLMFYVGERRKKIFHIKRLPPIDAIEEAVGRCVELGRPMHFTPGTATLTRMEAPGTIAGIAILGYVARLAARLGVRLIATCQMPETYPLVRETVRESFITEGKIDYYNDEDVIYMPQVKAAAGLMQREHVGANFLMGGFWHEGLVLAEAGAIAGAINIGGIAAPVATIPFLVICCDYCLMGEELYAASAYITKDPVLTSTIAGQDYIKVACVVLILIGTILSTMGLTQFASLFAV